MRISVKVLLWVSALVLFAGFIFFVFFTPLNWGNPRIDYVNKLPEPETPSMVHPITQTDPVVVRPEGQFGMKVSVFNPMLTPLNLSVSISCGDINITQSITKPKTVQSKASSTFPVTGFVPRTTAPGKYLCHGAVTDSIVPQSDFILEVQ